MRAPLLRLALLLAAAQYAEGSDLCEQCVAPTALPCVAADGCEEEGTLIDDVVIGGPLPCKKLTCDSGRFITEPKQPKEVTELVCKGAGGASEWDFDGVSITNATCVKKVSCGKIGHLKSACDNLTDFQTCAQIDLEKDDDKLACTAPSGKMFFKPKDGAWAEETADIKCELFSGKWMRGTNEVAKDDSVICAEYKYESCEANAALNLKSDCGATPKCANVTFNDAVPSTCTAPQDLYVEGTSWEKKTIVECDRKDGNWKDDAGVVLAAGTNVVCSESAPIAGAPSTSAPIAGAPSTTAPSTTAPSTTAPSTTAPSTTQQQQQQVPCTGPGKTLTSDCDATVKTAADCEMILSINDDDAVNCAAPNQLHVNVGTGWVQKQEVKCDKNLGKWKDDAGGIVADASNVICYKGGDPNLPPSPLCGSGCVAFPADTLFDCKPDEGCVRGAEITNNVNNCMEMTCDGQDFFVDNTGSRIDTPKILCSGQNQWQQVTGTAVTNALCVEKFECQKRNALSTTPKADGTEVCAACTTVDLSVDNPTCASGDRFFHKTTGGLWTEAATLSCDVHSGKWMQTPAPSPSQPAPDAAAMAAGDVVVCAATLPPNDPCTACGSVDPSTFCDANGGATAPPCTASTNQFITEAATDGTTVCQQMKCDGTTDMLFINDATVLAAGEMITCAADNKWKDKDGTEITKAVCVSAINCQAGSPLKSTCSAVSSKCDEIDLDANGDLTCTITPSHVLYTQPAAGGAWTKHAAVFCDPRKGHWQTGETDIIDPTIHTTNVTSLDKDDLVICAPPDKLPDRILACPALEYDCEPGHEADPTGCVPVVDKTATTLACPQPSNPPPPINNLYFKHKNEHYQQATSVKCDTVTGKWMVTYNYGIREDNKKELELSDRVICAKKNPEPVVCKLITAPTKDIKGATYIIQKYKSASEPKLPDEPSRGAGDTLSVINEKIQSFISSTPSSDVLTPSVKPVCSQSGKWEKPVTNSPTKAYEEYGDHVAVATIKCKHNCKVPTGIPVTNNNPFIPNVNLNYVRTTEGGMCSQLECNGGDQYFAIKDETDDLPLLFFNGMGNAHVECEGENRWKLVKDQLIGVAREINVKYVECVQQLHCLSKDFAKAGTPPCPTGDKYSTAGCVQLVDVHPYISAEPYDKISCPEGKKLFVQKAEGTGDKATLFWYELQGREISCTIERNNPRAGTWNATLASGDPFPIESDPANSFFCADSNPDERPTTTTTTTTAAPPPPICTLCENHLPKAESCNNCVNNTVLAANTNDAECVMTAMDTYQILIGEATEVDELICDREEPISWFERRCETVKVNGQDNVTCKAHGARITKFNARLKDKENKLKPLAYVVIAVTLTAIGGMGIGCVMIFLRMRKDLSEKEKKKERGVTKKYTTANVMKTSGKSSGGRSELGKSKEPTKSKMEENEDAPTLKL